MKGKEDADNKAIADLKRAEHYILITNHGLKEDSGGMVWGAFPDLMALYLTLGAKMYSLNKHNFEEAQNENN